MEFEFEQLAEGLVSDKMEVRKEAIKKLEYMRMQALAFDREMKEKEQKTVKPQYKFTLSVRMFQHELIFDNSCVTYTLLGGVTNKEELRKVGKAAFEGAMGYIYNKMTQRFVMAISGGARFVEDEECWAELSTFIAENPNGGDVTHIISKYKGVWSN